MPRFVILEHDYPELHWDFMLEAGDTLRTWKLTAPPESGQTIKALASFNHRIIYLDYEGPISDNRGAVIRWDKGSFNWKQDSEGHVRIDIRGGILRGSVELVREQDDAWQLTLSG